MRLEVCALLFQLARGNRRDERIGVDLAVRMMQRDADFDAAVLEREHVLRRRHRAPSARSDPPRRRASKLEVPERQRAERRGRILREDHHLA